MNVEVEEVPLIQIQDDNIRSRVSPQSLQGLIESLRAVGQLYPVRLRPLEAGYVLTDGHRRVQALRALGQSSVLAIIEHAPLDDVAKLEQALVSNIQREDLSPLDKAKGIAQLMRASGLKASDVAARIGLSAPEVTKLLAYLRFPAELAERLDAKGIGPTTVYELARVEDPAERAVLAECLMNGDLTRDSLSGRVKRGKNPNASPRASSASRFSASLGDGQSVNVSWRGSGDLDEVIGLLEDALQRARRARAKGLSAKTLAKMLREEAKAQSVSGLKEEHENVG